MSKIVTLIVAVFCLLFLILNSLIFKYRAGYSLVGYLIGLGFALTYVFHFEKVIDQLIFYKKISITGYVASIPVSDAKHTSFLFDIIKICENEHCRQQSAKLKLSWYKPYPVLTAGDRWSLTVQLREPRNFSNPGSANYVNQLWQQKIAGLGNVMTKGNNQRLGSSYLYPITRLRQIVTQGIAEALPASNKRGLIQALTVGDTSLILQEDWQILSRTGTSHLVAISGLHIGLITGAVYFLIQWLWRSSAFFILFLPVKQASALVSLVFALLYALLAGFSIPTQRAFIMIFVFMAAQFFNRQISSWRLILLALLAVILWNPFSLLMPGFWLSFTAVAVIFYGLLGRLSLKKNVMQWIWMQLILFFGLMPLTLFIFKQASANAVLSNAIAIPWVSYLVVPLCLMAFILYFILPNAAEVLWQWAEKLLTWLWHLLDFFSTHIYIAKNPIEILTIGQLIIFFIAVLLLLMPIGLPGRGLGIVWLMMGIVLKPPSQQAGELVLTLLDVGQGLSAVLQTKHHVLVYDAGSRFSQQFDLGKLVVLPYLKQSGIDHLDKLVISHNDNDHNGGAEAILNTFPWAEVLQSEAQSFAISKIDYCHQGQRWEWDHVVFEILHPPPVMLETSRNNRSCVLRVSVGPHRILLPGDIEVLAERLLLREAHQLQVSILIAPHHGSKTSSSARFINAVNPKIVVFSVGYHNKFHHPHPLVTTRYLNKSIKIYRTDESGAITFILNSKAPIPAPREYRKNKQAYWLSYG